MLDGDRERLLGNRVRIRNRRLPLSTSTAADSDGRRDRATGYAAVGDLGLNPSADTRPAHYEGGRSQSESRVGASKDPGGRAGG
jgi:hypothetical protein